MPIELKDSNISGLEIQVEVILLTHIKTGMHSDLPPAHQLLYLNSNCYSYSSLVIMLLLKLLYLILSFLLYHEE